MPHKPESRVESSAPAAQDLDERGREAQAPAASDACCALLRPTPPPKSNPAGSGTEQRKLEATWQDSSKP